MKTQLIGTFMGVVVGMLASCAGAAAGSYGPASQAGGALGMLEHHPVLSVVAHLCFLGMVLCLGVVVVAALVKPPME